MNRSNRHFTFGVFFGLVVGILMGASAYSLVEYDDPSRPFELLGPPPAFLLGDQEDKHETMVVTMAEIMADKQTYIRHLEKENEQLDAALRLLMGQLGPEPTPANPPKKPSVGKSNLES